ncbi:UMP kinase [Candidatus Microgenomates bacterium]|nr:UMP kinase [Candidatus Microgenomates bacterium]
MSVKETVVLSLGGSLIAPNGGINTQFLKKFNEFIRQKVTAGWRFFIVTGGGSIARFYQNAAQEIGGNLVRDDIDWLGIHATRLNAHLIRTIFRDIAHIRVIKDPSDVEITTEPVVVAAGWKPGWSTDYIATVLAKEYKINTLVNMSDVPMVYEKDPKKHPEAKPIEKLSWRYFHQIVGDKWDPGLNVPFDPVATKLAHEIGLKVIILKGDNFENLDSFFKGKKFIGTVINEDNDE